MRKKTIMTALVAAAIISSSASALPTGGKSAVWRKALDLYQNGMYESARTLFESQTGDPTADGYVVLCALKMRTDDSQQLLSEYLSTYPSSSLVGRIRYESARIFFDEGRYARAAEELSKVPSDALETDEMPEYMFMCGYSAFSMGDYPQALQFFTVLEALPMSDYTAPGRYYTGVINYENRSFAEAEASFWKANADPRFTDLTDFYIVDCEFNQKNYDFTIREGERIYKTVPAERRERLARLISESYLIKGEKEKAREYYDSYSRKDMTRKDYFYAGSVLYNVDDYQGAIDNFTMMTDRSDSLGQIANYNLGNAYIRTRNQVSAMNAFLDASKVDYDPKITEDAYFNYAKLAFDLNKDTSGFAGYIKRYSTKAKGEQIYGYMALAALVDHDYAGAVEAYDNIDELDPDMHNNYTKANFLRGEQLFSSGSYRDAAPYFKATAYFLPKTDRLNQFSRYWLGESYYRTGSYSDAAKNYVELYNSDALYGQTEGALLAYNAGYSYFKAGDYSSAARWFDTYIASKNELYREDAMNRRADCDFGRRDYKAAIASYQKVLDEFYTPNDIYPYYQQALAYGLTGSSADKKKKVSVLMRVEDASSDSPMFSEAWYELGRAQMEQKSYNAAIKSFTYLKDNTKDNTYVARALLGLGMVNRNASNYDAALENYKKVVSDYPSSEYSEEALLAIESIYRSRKQPQKYLEYVESIGQSSSKTDAEKEAIYYNTAEQLYLAGNWSETLTSCQKYLDNYPNGSERYKAYFYTAEAYKAQGDKEKACEWYAKAMDGGSDFSFAEVSKLNYATLSYGLERYQDAYNGYLSLLSTAKIESNKTTARVGMMRSAYRSKDYPTAIVAADGVSGDSSSDAALKREAQYVKAKSCLATSKRDEAMEIFKTLSAQPSTSEGAEALYMLIQNNFDTGNFDAVESEVYSFSQKAQGQSYWLAKAYLVLGDSFQQRGQLSQAKATFESIRDGYEPESGTDDIAANVNMRLERLAKLMEK